ncbi:hypothetical protein [Alienimonas sp. DA493]|uniref:hypothetical protein n=1 Tax=Alienimonas sp. DA493 TaxID=3373605 RepID=UPI0037550E91
MLDLSGTRVTAAAADPAFDWPPVLEWLALPWALIDEDPLLVLRGFESERRGGPEFTFGPHPE